MRGTLNLSLGASCSPGKGIWASGGMEVTGKQRKEYFNLKVHEKKLTGLCVLTSLAQRSVNSAWDPLKCIGHLRIQVQRSTPLHNYLVFPAIISGEGL